MGWIRKWRMRRMGLKDVPHYAPDVGLTAVDYIEPISPEKRLRRAEYIYSCLVHPLLLHL